MEVIFGLGKVKKRKFYRPAVTLGVFDGLHKGHIELLRQTKRCAGKIRGSSIVITFFPHPQKESCLYPLAYRLRLLKQLGIDICIVLKFTKNLSRISAKSFIKDILVKRIHAHYIIVGENFHFGKDAKGAPHILRKFSKIYDYRLKVVPKVKYKKRAISTTFVRYLISKGRIKEVREILLRPVTIWGEVVRGRGLGKLLGFPTANIKPYHELLLPKGVYIIKAYLDKKVLKGLCYIGTKPTINKFKRDLSCIHIEMHLFKFHENLYHRNLRIQFFKKIRTEKKFQTISSLASQIEKDVREAKNFFFP